VRTWRHSAVLQVHPSALVRHLSDSDVGTARDAAQQVLIEAGQSLALGLGASATVGGTSRSYRSFPRLRPPPDQACQLPWNSAVQPKA
jgi:hypothetical protein